MADEKYGDFVEEVDENANVVVEEEQIPARIRLPRNGEFLGVVKQRLGGNKMNILCSDGKTRNGRVPGRFRRKMWLRPGNFVVVKPWEHDDGKADIIFQYKGGAINQLKKKGLVNFAKEEF